MESNQQPESNLERLQQSGILKNDYSFSDADKQLIESLSRAEVDSLIAVSGKLGRDFLIKHGGGETAGILF